MLGLLRKLTGRRHDPHPGLALRPRDCHCHVVPGVDDGSRTTEESLAMLRLLHKAGARTIVATPHIFPGRFPNEPDPLRRAFDHLQHARARAEIDVELELGAEHYLDDMLRGRIEAGRVLAFGPERYVLFETTTGAHAPAALMEIVFALRDRGFTPLMAHVERYHYLRGDEGRELCEDLKAAGVRFQVNRTVGKANVPGHGPRGEFIAWLLERGWVDEVGSDLHRPTPEGRPHAMTATARRHPGPLAVSGFVPS
jgi:tyrosine-protein phosphatase YwqE